MGRSNAVAALAFLAAACAPGEYGPKESVGVLGGAVLGGLVGSEFGGGEGRLVATGIGTLLGAFLGSEVGRSLDRADLLYAQQAANAAYRAPVGETIVWQNPDTGHSGSVTPLRSGYVLSSGEPCREFQQTIIVGGRTQTAFGTACREADGNWRIVG